MDQPLIACADCGQHTLATACACAHCGHKLRDCHGKPLAAAAVALMGLTSLTGCFLKSESDYGVPESSYIDADDDGWSESDGDCDDDDPAIHPDAEETPGDGVDSNCDGSDDT